jgi:antitoxin FitA
MAQVLVRDLDPETLERLKSRAKLHGRSLQGELKAILESAASYSMTEARDVGRHWRERLSGRPMSDSGELLREDRDR